MYNTAPYTVFLLQQSYYSNCLTAKCNTMPLALDSLMQLCPEQRAHVYPRLEAKG